MSEVDNLILIGIMLLIIATGFVGLFNLAGGYVPALDVSFKGGFINIIWTILLRIIVAPLMIIVPSWVIFNVVKENI